jgi:hypothetical protein
MRTIHRAIRVFGLVAMAIVAMNSTAWSWGSAGHTLITEDAIELLPKEMLPFYEANSRYVVALVMLPDDWRASHWEELAPQHYIDLDMLSQPPFTDLITDRETAEKKFGKENVWKAGVAPWVIAERYHKLVEAFRKNDPEEIVLQSALLAHHVEDVHVPFHATKNWDGKKPEAKGLHARWETNLVALQFKPQSIHPSAPAKIDDILKSAFGWCVDSYGFVDTICNADEKARERDPGLASLYYKMLSDDTGAILQQRITSAVEDLAGTYVAAWKEAGQPKLSDKPAALFWGR